MSTYTFVSKPEHNFQYYFVKYSKKTISTAGKYCSEAYLSGHTSGFLFTDWNVNGSRLGGGGGGGRGYILNTGLVGEKNPT